MTPEETTLLIQAWNDAQESMSGNLPPPTADEVDELVRRYG